MRTLALAAALFITVAFLVPSSAFAISDPPIFSCDAVVGSKVADNTGNHGIPGNYNAFSGQDQVYKIDEDHVLQCFCDNNNNGIQSNWWKASNLSESDRDFFIRRGWVFIPSGSAWGLTGDPYLVKNDNYACNESGIGGGDLRSRILGASTLGATGTQQTMLVSLFAGLFFGYVAYRLGKE